MRASEAQRAAACVAGGRATAAAMALAVHQRLDDQDEVGGLVQQHVPTSPGSPWLLAEIEQRALDLQRPRPGARPTLMAPVDFALSPPRCTTRCADSTITFQPARLRGEAVIDLLEVEEVARIEQADPVAPPLAHEVEAARHPVAIAHRGVIPRHVVDHPGRKPPLQAVRARERVERRRKESATRLQLAVAADQAHAEDAAVRMARPCRPGWPSMESGGDEGIGVEQQEIRRANVRQRRCCSRGRSRCSRSSGSLRTSRMVLLQVSRRAVGAKRCRRR